VLGLPAPRRAAGPSRAPFVPTRAFDGLRGRGRRAWRPPPSASPPSSSTRWSRSSTDLQAFIEFADDVHLDGVVENITVPFLIAHGANDRQIPLGYAHRSYEQAINSPKRELRVFTPDEGATEHIGLDHLPHVSTFIADWVADTFAELDQSRP
jgi:fermentation-respiration switch protein FrsA (DUF1100 family)